jgi:Tol biopolymer transport system component
VSSDLRDQIQASLGDTFTLERELPGGGMSHVFVARDRSLDRDVVVKVLPPDAAASVSAERFKREIAVAARLQHPHIVALISAGATADGLPYYTMPFVEGESLRARLARDGELPIADTVAILRDVAGALAYAHERGIVHRDIKPDNVMLSGGSAMVTDFGVARAVAAAGSDTATAAETITQLGVALGTPAYMAPEQAAAERTVDGRADLYALGCMAYEMLTGQAPFAGRTAPAQLAAHVMELPEAIQRRRPSVPPPLATLVMQCLEKRPADRPKSASDVQRTLEGLRGAGVLSNSRSLPRGVAWTAWTAIAAVLALGAWGLARRAPQAMSRPVTRFVVAGVGDPALNGAPSLTPDGSRLVYVDVGDPSRSIYVRPLDSLGSRALPGTEGAVGPFVSPDGKWVGFFTGNKLKKVLLDGSAPAVTLGDAPLLARASWGSNDIIVIGALEGGGLVWIAAAGGPLHDLTTINTASGEAEHESPFILPGGTSVIFTAVGGGKPAASGGKLELAVVPLDPSSLHPAQHVMLGATGRVVGMRDGMLVLEDGMLVAVPYDAVGHRLSGKPVTVLEDPDGRVGSASLAADGTMLYTRSQASEVMLVDTQGIARPLLGPSMPAASGASRMQMGPRVSPDGKRLLLQVVASQGQNLWLYDLASRTPMRLTAEGAVFGSEWVPDGRRVVYSTNDGKTSTVWLVAADAASPPKKLFDAPGLIWSTFTPDSKTLVFQRMIDKVWSLWTMSLDAAQPSPVPLLREAFNDYMPHVSPDGHWLAYVSAATDHEEVFVRPFPGPGAPVQVSDGGGTEPMWAPDGRRLFYRQGRALVAASVTTPSGFAVTSRAVLFQGAFDGGMPHANYAVTRDGQHFVMVTAGRVTTDAVVVRNWGEEMAARVARAR